MKPALASVAFAGLFIGLLLLSVGCDSKSSPPRESDATKPVEPPPAVVAGGDSNAIETALESVAKVRRDGDGAIIEVDLRDSAIGGVLETLQQLPKLRSVLLSGQGVTDEAMLQIGKISTLENLDLRGCAIGDAGVAHLGGLDRLKSIKFSGKEGGTTITDASMKTLGELKRLNVIAIDFLPISDQGIESLSSLGQLRELYMAGTAATNGSAATLANFSQLAKLRIGSTDFGSEGLKQIESLSGLVELDVSDCAGVDDSALPTLGGFPNLAKLNLYNTSIGDADWGQLSSCTALKWLNVDKTGVGDESLDEIGNLKSLTFLHLGSTKITDAALEKLAGLSNLEQLIVTRTAVTQDGVERLRQSLPSTEIQLEYVPGK